MEHIRLLLPVEKNSETANLKPRISDKKRRWRIPSPLALETCLYGPEWKTPVAASKVKQAKTIFSAVLNWNTKPFITRKLIKMGENLQNLQRPESYWHQNYIRYRYSTSDLIPVAWKWQVPSIWPVGKHQNGRYLQNRRHPQNDRYRYNLQNGRDSFPQWATRTDTRTLQPGRSAQPHRRRGQLAAKRTFSITRTGSGDKLYGRKHPIKCTGSTR